MFKLVLSRTRSTSECAGSSASEERMRLQHLIATVIVLSAGSALASPYYDAPLDEYTEQQTRADLVRLAESNNIDEKTVDRLMERDVVATSNDTGCPGVDVDVVNATHHTVWNILVEIDQTSGIQKRTDTLHLPYMLARTKVRVTVPCVEDYTYRSRYDYSNSSAISIDYSAKGAKSLAEALPDLVEQQQDYKVLTGRTIEPQPAAGPTLLNAALAMDDHGVAGELVLGIAKAGIGSKELGAAVEANPNGAFAAEVAASLSKLAPAQQAELARALLHSSAADHWKAQLEPMIDHRLCTGSRVDALALWIAAQGDTGIPVQSLRERVRARCKPTLGDADALVMATGTGSGQAGASLDASAALDAIEPALFERVVAVWKARHLAPSTSSFLRDTADPARFDAAAAIVAPDSLGNTIADVVTGRQNAVTAHKVEWITANLGKVGAVDTLVNDVTQELITGKISSDGMRTVAHAIASKNQAVADDVMKEYAHSHANVFDASKLAGKVDLGELLAFDSSLQGCGSTLDTLRACAKQIAEYKDGAYAKLGDVIRPELATNIEQLVHNNYDDDVLVTLAGELKAAGIPRTAIVAKACHDADYGDGNRLAVAEKIDPDAACVSELKGREGARHRKNIFLAIAAIFGLVLPLPVGGFTMRRRYRKLQKDLPALAGERPPTVDKLEERLGERGLARSLRDGVAAGNRELGNTPAAAALAAVDAMALTEAVTVTRRAVKSADAASSLIRRANDAVYLVALPVREPRPQIVQRYLGAEWPEHLAAIQHAAGMPVLALIVLCGPDATEASLLIGYSDGRHASDPEVLLDAKEARARGANSFRHVMTLAAAAPGKQEA
jgi:hypothetical protein